MSTISPRLAGIGARVSVLTASARLRLEAKTALWVIGALATMLALNLLVTPSTAAPITPPAYLIPVAGVPATGLADSWGAARDGHRHEGVDIRAARGTLVRAVQDGRIVKLTRNVRGGLMVYQLDAQGRLVFCYAHLDAYAPGLKEGDIVRQGEPIGAVGQTGNATGPHLHFEIRRIETPGAWRSSVAIDPYPALTGGA